MISFSIEARHQFARFWTNATGKRLEHIATVVHVKRAGWVLHSTSTIDCVRSEMYSCQSQQPCPRESHMKNLKLVALLEASGIPLNHASYKVHLATGSGWLPLDAFFEGRFKEWQEDQRGRNFGREMVIGLIHLGSARWLFVGVYRVLGCELRDNGRYRYSTELLDGQEGLIGRVIVEHKRTARASYLIGMPDGGPFHVAEVLAQPITVGDFPGYTSVCETYARLRIIVQQNLASWRGALANMKGVYLITDLATGKLYVGSATGGDGLWQRWCSYVATGHGGNRDLKAILGEHGTDYVQNFQYSLLEVADSRATDEYVLARESFWKDVVASRVHGYNAN
jgi:hypothetical protein